MPPRKASRSVFGLFPVGAKPTHKSAPRRFRCLLATWGCCDSPVLPRGGNESLLSLYRPDSRSRWASDVWDKSGTETHIPIAIHARDIQIEGKQAVIGGVSVSASAQSQPLRY